MRPLRTMFAMAHSLHAASTTSGLYSIVPLDSTASGPDVSLNRCSYNFRIHQDGVDFIERLPHVLKVIRSFSALKRVKSKETSSFMSVGVYFDHY